MIVKTKQLIKHKTKQWINWENCRISKFLLSQSKKWSNAFFINRTIYLFFAALSSSRWLRSRACSSERPFEQRRAVRRILPVLSQNALLALVRPADRRALRRYKCHPASHHANAVINRQPGDKKDENKKWHFGRSIFSYVE